MLATPIRRLVSAVLVTAALAACTDSPATEADLPLFVSAADLAASGYDVPGLAARQVSTRTRYVDGSMDIVSEMEAPEDAGYALYLSTSASYDRTEADARSTYGLARRAHRIGVRIGGVRVDERPEFFSYGDESYYARLVRDSIPVGTMFGTRAGTRTYSILLVGVHFSDAAEWEAFIGPRLAYWSRYDPAEAAERDPPTAP